MKTLNEAKQILKKNKPILKSKFGVKEIGIFGSFVHNEARKRSDIDILVEFSKIPGIFKFMDLEDYLQKVLKTKVDLVRKKALRVELRDNILEETVFI
ncbi:MAG: nucleotidyltransferase family protein [Elusimicrobiota bacterium]